MLLGVLNNGASSFMQPAFTTEVTIVITILFEIGDDSVACLRNGYSVSSASCREASSTTIV